jgi:uncharacterized protein DUF4399
MTGSISGRARRLSLLMACALALVLTGCGGSEKQTTTPPASPSLNIVSPQAGATVQGDVVVLTLAAQGLQIVKADGDTSGKSGHFHVFVDQDPPPAGAGIPKARGIVHSADNPIKLSGLTIGRHRLVAVLGDGGHRRIGTAQAETTVGVEGPTVQASAPAVAAKGEPVVVTLAVQGIRVATPNGDTSGKTGHFHLFIDRAPSPAGQPIPKAPGIIHTPATSVPVPGLAAGEHTIIVVMGDGLHVPLKPPVEAKVTVVVQ